MAQTELYDFVMALRALSVPGVTRTFPGPPGSITTAGMPAMWLHTCGLRTEPATRGYASWPILRAELWVIVSPVSQSNVAAVIARATQLAGALDTALRAANLAAGPPTIDIRVTAGLSLNEKSYWGLIATVEAQG